MNTPQQIAELERILKAQSTPERAANEKRYLKSNLKFLGATIPVIRATGAQFKRSHPKLGREELLNLGQGLWESEVHELRSLAINLLERYLRLLQPQDLARLETWLNQADTWAHVDWLSIKVAGPLLAEHPEKPAILERWARHENFWVRRASLLVHLDFLKGGQGDFEPFARLAEGMLAEREFFIRKAIGWVLREVSKKRPQLTADFLMAHRSQVSGLTLREGSKYLPQAQQEALLPIRNIARGGRLNSVEKPFKIQ